MARLHFSDPVRLLALVQDEHNLYSFVRIYNSSSRSVETISRDLFLSRNCEYKILAAQAKDIALVSNQGIVTHDVLTVVNLSTIGTISIADALGRVRTYRSYDVYNMMKATGKPTFGNFTLEHGFILDTYLFDDNGKLICEATDNWRK